MPFSQQGLEQAASMGLRHQGDFLGCAGGYDLASPLSTFGAEVDDEIGGFDYVQIMLYHQDRVARLHQ